MRERIRAAYIGDNSLITDLITPDVMGSPREDQLQGTKLERLAEHCGRICYDSLGKGRSSKDYHAHILEVKHGSVLEHGNFTVSVAYLGALKHLLPVVANRPGVWVAAPHENNIRITLNLRSLVEWDSWRSTLPHDPAQEGWLRDQLMVLGSNLAPAYVTPPEHPRPMAGAAALVAAPEHPEEAWVSLLLCGSRGMSHEQVRHGDRTAISQRSTRYVDESESAWISHPLLTLYGEENDGADLVLGDAGTTSVVKTAQDAYRTAVRRLQPWLASKGVDKFSARKQARGAARGYLGNALYTEMVFSASVAQWRRMLHQRCSDAADAEIRVLYSDVLESLRESAFRDAFSDLSTEPASDGLGKVIARNT